MIFTTLKAPTPNTLMNFDLIWLYATCQSREHHLRCGGVELGHIAANRSSRKQQRTKLVCSPVCEEKQLQHSSQAPGHVAQQGPPSVTTTWCHTMNASALTSLLQKPVWWLNFEAPNGFRKEPNLPAVWLDVFLPTDRLVSSRLMGITPGVVQ